MKRFLAATLFMLAGMQAFSNNNSPLFPINHVPIRTAIHSFQVSKNQSKLFLNWSVSLNQDADRIEIEKSTDNKHFKMAALVFTSENNANEQYAFYEKESTTKVYYRLKLVAKDGHTTFSEIIATGK
ncbi:MAG: hypothetical protein EOO20_21855 [Chryseobacterium sp.]|nr:MAG: hypothetical protein EOO20_21855 [Chryseobacterium sp.]